MLNSVNLQARLCADAELHQTKEGTAVTTARVAWSFNAGDDNHETVFIDATIWGARAEAFVKYTHKGSQVLLSGRLSQRAYTNKDGKQVTVTEIRVNDFELLDPKPAEDEKEPEPTPKTGYSKKNYTR